MREAEYKRLKRQIEAAFRRDMEALDRVWKMASKQASPHSRIASSNGAIAIEKGELSKAVEETVDTMVTGEFGLSDIERILKHAHYPWANQINRQSLSNALRRLCGKRIERVAEGVGRKQARYVKIEERPKMPLNMQ